jgi:hypothetical protein
MHLGQFSSYDISRLRPSKFNNIPSLCTWYLMFVAICKFVKLWKKLWYIYGSILCFILISCKDPQSSILFSFVMGNFDWPIKNKFNQALDSPKIDMVQSLLLSIYIGYKSTTQGKGYEIKWITIVAILCFWTCKENLWFYIQVIALIGWIFLKISYPTFTSQTFPKKKTYISSLPPPHQKTNWPFWMPPSSLHWLPKSFIPPIFYPFLPRLMARIGSLGVHNNSHWQFDWKKQTSSKLVCCKMVFSY